MVYAAVRDVQYRRSPLIKGGLKILVNVSSPNICKPLRSYLIKLNYKEPVNGNFNDWTDEILKELDAENVEDDDKENVLINTIIHV